MDAEIQLAQTLIHQGRKKEAANILKEAIRTNPHDYRYWVLLSTISTPESKKRCLQRAKKLAQRAKAETIPLASSFRSPAPASPRLPVERMASVAPALQATPTPVINQHTPAQHAAEHLQQTKTVDQSERSSTKIWPFAILAMLLAIVGVGFVQFFPDSQAESVAQNDLETAVLQSEIAMVPSLESGDLEIADAAIVNEQPESAEVLAETDADLVLAEPTASPTPSPSPTFSPIQSAQEISAKPISLVSETTRAPWTPTPLPTNTPTPSPTPVPTFVNETYAIDDWPLIEEGERWVDVNLTTQMLTAYEGRTPVMQTVISSGRPPYFTVTGQFRIYLRYPSQTMDGRRLGFDYVTPGVPHVQYFYKDFALHGAFWHDDFGTPVSHGCVNINLPDAEWLYNWAGYGTLVNVHY